MRSRLGSRARLFSSGGSGPSQRDPTPRYGKPSSRTGLIPTSVEKSCRYSRIPWGFEYSATATRPHGMSASGDGVRETPAASWKKDID
ncbi:MAG: hypothetical protein NTY63_02585 [Candidatus Bipolaricaulota bacterium]|nr:hypothetical protein [Candidatus Bipolaricaulota bacterium]